jgi:hypothetical protein
MSKGNRNRKHRTQHHQNAPEVLNGIYKPRLVMLGFIGQTLITLMLGMIVYSSISQANVNPSWWISSIVYISIMVPLVIYIMFRYVIIAARSFENSTNYIYQGSKRAFSFWGALAAIIYVYIGKPVSTVIDDIAKDDGGNSIVLIATIVVAAGTPSIVPFLILDLRRAWLNAKEHREEDFIKRIGPSYQPRVVRVDSYFYILFAYCTLVHFVLYLAALNGQIPQMNISVLLTILGLFAFPIVYASLQLVFCRPSLSELKPSVFYLLCMLVLFESIRLFGQSVGNLVLGYDTVSNNWTFIISSMIMLLPFVYWWIRSVINGDRKILRPES